MQEVWPTEDIARSFGRVLRAHRTAKLFSQERLAHEAGIDRTYVGLLERGCDSPPSQPCFSCAQRWRSSR
jgi:DNA-binding XRE family transcriptional regulator